MKTITITLASLLCLHGMVKAQRTATAVKPDATLHTNIVATSPAVDSSAGAGATTPASSTMTLISKMDQTRIYRWDNGQRSTPAGRQAGDPNAVYARIIGDSAL